jgi:hypothetical protein
VNIVLPSIRQGLGAGDDVIQLVMSGFAAAYAVLPVRAWGEQAAHGCPKNVP